METLTRKLFTSFFTTLMVSIMLGYLFILSYEIEPNMGNHLLGWTMVIILYVGVGVFIFGNIVSLCIEYAQMKLGFATWISIGLHGIFGSVNGLFFMEWGFALIGVAVALCYALADLLFKRIMNNHALVVTLMVSPFMLYFLSWGILQAVSPSQPPFTLNDAVEFVTSGEGTNIDRFPKEVGVWQGEINGYSVEREVSATETGKETYIVTLTESWKKENETGLWFMSYTVDSSNMTLYEEHGEEPPYE